MRIRTSKKVWVLLVLTGLAFPIAPGHASVDSTSHLISRGLYSDSEWDGMLELRLMPELRLSRHRLWIHYEAIAADHGQPMQDRQRLFDLTKVLDESGNRKIWHRLDRLAYRYSADWGDLTIGRHAITWGNGLVFNPLDILNPFAPTDVERDYKTGDDMILANIRAADWNGRINWQVLAVPRRDLSSDSIRSETSSLALKGHLLMGDSEWEAMAARHYDEPVMGIAHIGYFGEAVWRLDATLTFADDGSEYFSTVANIDYSWTWQGMNLYGSIEFHYNGFGSGENEPWQDNGPLMKRLDRGELFTTGRTYLAPALQVEIHPLLQFYQTVVANLEDNSALLLPRLVWNLSEDTELTFGGSLSAGGNGSEFGPQPDQVYLWLKGFF